MNKNHRWVQYENGILSGYIVVFGELNTAGEIWDANTDFGKWKDVEKIAVMLDPSITEDGNSNILTFAQIHQDDFGLYIEESVESFNWNDKMSFLTAHPWYFKEGSYLTRAPIIKIIIHQNN